MYVVTKNGIKLNVDDSKLDYENDYIPFQQNVGLYSDDTKLIPVWIAEFQKCLHNRENEKDQFEFVAEKMYDHKPTMEEMLWAMSQFGLTRYDIVTITQSYQLDIE